MPKTRSPSSPIPASPAASPRRRPTVHVLAAPRRRWPGRARPPRRCSARLPPCPPPRIDSCRRARAAAPSRPRRWRRRSRRSCRKTPSSSMRRSPSASRSTPARRTPPPHDWLQLTGGAIGDGLPLATGAADRRARPPRRQPSGRRLGALHGAGAVDAGAREPRRHHRHPLQPPLRHPRRRARQRRRGRPARASRELFSLGDPDIDWVRSPTASASKRRAPRRWSSSPISSPPPTAARPVPDRAGDSVGTRDFGPPGNGLFAFRVYQAGAIDRRIPSSCRLP